MSYVLSANIPLMALAFALWVGIPLWLVARRSDWRGKPEARTVPAYMARALPRSGPRGSAFRSPPATTAVSPRVR